MKLLGLLIVVVLLGFGAYWLGLIDIGTTGDLKTPTVSVTGGEMPDVQVETGSVSVGKKELSVDVPTVEVERAGDDGSTEQ